MTSDKLAAKLNDLMNGEHRAHHLYLQMAAWASMHKLDGVKDFLLGHAAEERGHMMKFFEYLDDLGAPIALNGLPDADLKFADVKALFLRVQSEEQQVSRNIFEVIDLARAEHDYATDQFLQWFAGEQHEEEKMALKILDRIDVIGEGENALYFIDLELAKFAKAD